MSTAPPCKATSRRVKTPGMASEHPEAHPSSVPGDPSPEVLLAQLRGAIAAGGPSGSLAQELLAERAAEANAETDAVFSPAMSPEEFLAHLAKLDREASAHENADVRPVGEGPLLLCQRYGAGNLARGDLVEALVAYPYAQVQQDPYDFSPDPPGAWSEVEDAEGLGLIDPDLYSEIFHRRHPG